MTCIGQCFILVLGKGERFMWSEEKPEYDYLVEGKEKGIQG